MDQALYTPHTADEDCSCPIHVDGKPQTLPFAHRVSIDPDLDRAVAESIYEHHHFHVANVQPKYDDPSDKIARREENFNSVDIVEIGVTVGVNRRRRRRPRRLRRGYAEK